MKYAKSLTVGMLIDHLQTLDPSQPIELAAKADSYRGYYNHVAVAPGSSTAGKLLAHLKSKLGSTMTGYKGGDFTFHDGCQVFVADYGDCGPLLALMDGELVTIEHPFVW